MPPTEHVPPSPRDRFPGDRHEPRAGGSSVAGAQLDPADRHPRSRRFLQEVTYPHSIHPALVPGVSVEDQKVRYGIDRIVFGVAAAAILAFIAWGVADSAQVTKVTTAMLTWVMTNLGWLFNGLAIVLLLFLLGVAVSPYGRIPLGLDGEEPEFSTASWTAMLFGAGIGIGIIFFGPYEPMTYFLSPRPGSAEPGTAEAVPKAMAQAALHWGVNAWAFYALVGLAVAYASYRRGRVPLMSSIFAPLMRRTPHETAAGRAIDVLAIIATLFGTAASLGIGALQIARGVEIVTGWGEGGNTAALVIIMVLTIGTIASAVSGLAKGIRWLSNINLVLALVLAVFFFVVGPTVFLLNMIPSVFVTYLGEMPSMLSASMADGPAMQQFLSSWTTFYWAWWVSWAPFVGIFTAKISRGRTVRQFVLGVLLIPGTIIILAFTMLGGTAIWHQRDSRAIAPDGTAETLPAPQDIFFTVLDQLPGAQLVAPIVIVMLAIFFITSSDSASLVNSQLSQRGNPEPNRLVTVFWAICMAGIAVVILLIGGQSALTGLQNLVTVSALPFAVVMIGMTIALLRDFSTDPMMIRREFREQALENAVRQGVTEYGDDFKLAVEPAHGEAEQWSVGKDFESTADEYTAWYERTDEDGRPVAYDYATNEYVEGVDDTVGRPTADGRPTAQSHAP
ncbi:choline/carnitine/betaine transport [Kytococcus aerolatus]|uniref:Choline/carnitine/betaine transport n=1 Tax=Kytococcus aerolatus TaxID=592308 RepID=A0A212TGM8_9MICO|nr:BCCT family transporter [Kytococcus aerolatus]SNC64976.1 choline/carnitine/betaine transport [Kytococcus aerolatus]